MPRGGARHGGPRQGTPGKAYPNRTDLMNDYAPDTQGTAGTGGTTAPEGSAPAQAFITPDMVTPLDAPSTRPDEHVMTGVGSSYSDGALDLVDQQLLAAYQTNPTAELRRVLDNLSYRVIRGQ